MSREKMFTREIAYTNVTAMVVDTTTAKVSNENFVVPFEENNNTKILAYLQKNVQKSDHPIVSIVSKETVKKLYGCTVEQFLTVAVELDENRKPIE